MAYFSVARRKMVEEQLQERHVDDPRVLEVMCRIPRHEFVDPGMARQAYEDRPLPIGFKQTISQPFIVGFMTAALQLQGGEKVLEIGTGCGYQTAVLCELASHVYSIERIQVLVRFRREEKKMVKENLVGCRFVRLVGEHGWELEN
ncbi:MAG: protein-L-isoaspartate O-methyltransferase [Deltaproteobacteria bacterium]|nr:protein-L-isoaspartate O-methyltransferase [Deltaproteobacteria bacterium]